MLPPNHKTSNKIKRQLKKAGLRALSTMAHTAAGALASETLLSRIDVRATLSAIVLAGLSAFLSAIAELNESDINDR